MSGTFLDAIAQSIDSTYFFGTDEPYEENVTEANAILAMPEMQAIRSALVRLAPCAWHSEMRGEPGSKLARNRIHATLEALDVPPNVIAWVVGDDRP